MNEISDYFAKYTLETIGVLFWLLLAISTGLIIYWVLNRKKYRYYSHEIPASLVRNYQESSNQNQAAFNSPSVGQQDTATVRRISDLDSKVGADQDELNRLLAQINELKEQVSSKDQIIIDLQKKIEELMMNADKKEDNNNEELILENKRLKERIAELEALLKAQEEKNNNSSNDEELEELRRKNKDLNSRLMEYEIIEDDLANLKVLQQENARLKSLINSSKDGKDNEESGSNLSEPENVVKKESIHLKTEQSFGKVQMASGDFFSKTPVKTKTGASKKKAAKEEEDFIDSIGSQSPELEELENVMDSKAPVDAQDDNTAEVESILSIEEGKDEASVLEDPVEEQSEATEKVETMETLPDSEKVGSSEASTEEEKDEEDSAEVEVAEAKSEENTTEEEVTLEKSPEKDGEKKSAEELLSEFEKMLG